MPTRAFDAVAAAYDQTFTYTETGRLQRQGVYAVLEKILTASNIRQVLELNCGTGEDAIWLAQLGCQVLATDIAPEMVAVAEQKGSQKPHTKANIRYQVLDSNQLQHLKGEEKYDLIFSNFGGLNCLSPEQLSTFAKESTRLLRADGMLIAVIMSNFCWWESLYFLLKRNWQQAWRRQSKSAIAAPLDEHTTIDTWYYSPKKFSSYFAPYYTEQLTVPIGFWLPPSYLDPFFRAKPRLLRLLDGLEKKSSRFSSLAAGADHYLLVLKFNA